VPTDHDPDALVAAIAGRRHGVVTIEELRASGLSTRAIQHRVRTERLDRVRRGVYVVAGHPASYVQTVVAAVLACGETAAASHSTGARLWDVPIPEVDAIEITTVLERMPRQEGVRLHQSGLLLDRDRTRVDSVPVHTPERIFVELSGRHSDEILGAAIDVALRRHITTLTRLWSCHRRLPLAPGRSPNRMERVLSMRVDDGTDTALEDRVFEAIRLAGLPLPEPQHRVVVGGRRRRIDLAYVDERVAIECDSFEWHRTRERFDDDRARANELVLAGWTVLRFTSVMSNDEIASAVRRALAAAHDAVSAVARASARLNAETG
jgi:very-short-patch-repair endonuclease